ncbi:MAG: hypothetical protein QM791_07000 [Ferruginibacter sp.]
MVKLAPVLMLITLLAGSCKKENVTTADCARLQDAMTKNDIPAVQNIVNTLIGQLASKTHTAGNLNSLVSSINSKCNFNAKVLCFACIETLPEQSEIEISFLQGFTESKRIIDITEKDNQMAFQNMHE